MSEYRCENGSFNPGKLAWSWMCTSAIKDLVWSRLWRAVIIVYGRVILAPERRTLPLTRYHSHHKTDWPSETMSHHMINIYLCHPVRWKKDNFLRMHLCYYSYLSPSRSSVCRIWTYWVTRSSLSATNSRAAEFSATICGPTLAYECDETEQIRISSVLFHAAWILLQGF